MFEPGDTSEHGAPLHVRRWFGSFSCSVDRTACSQTGHARPPVGFRWMALQVVHHGYAEPEREWAVADPSSVRRPSVAIRMFDHASLDGRLRSFPKQSPDYRQRGDVAGLAHALDDGSVHELKAVEPRVRFVMARSRRPGSRIGRPPQALDEGAAVERDVGRHPENPRIPLEPPPYGPLCQPRQPRRRLLT